MQAVLFKSCSHEYEAIFKSHGYNTIFIEPLQFNYVNLSYLSECLAVDDSKHYDGIILTSPRAIEALSKCWTEQDYTIWREKRTYAVGEASGKKINELINLNADGLCCGNAERLADFIINENLTGSKFLFPCGNLKTETIIQKLIDKGIDVEPVTVYETEENINLEKNISKLLQDQEQSLSLVFFSPSGAGYVYKYLMSKGGLPSLHFFAIGNLTSRKMETLGLTVSGVAAKPSAESLVEAMNAVLSR